MRRVIVESPYRGNFWQRWRNRRYARAAMHDCIRRGEAPFASHLLYTQRGVLRDHVESERKRGILAGFAWGAQAHAVVVYEDYGISDGMRIGIRRAKDIGMPVEYRSLRGVSLSVADREAHAPSLATDKGPENGSYPKSLAH